MKKRVYIILGILLIVLAIPFSIAAAEPQDLPYITQDDVGFMSFSGSNDASGFSASSAKNSWGKTNGSGVLGLVPKGGTIVVCGKGYVGAKYTLPKLSTPLLITSNYAGTNYKNSEPANNPSCAFKMASGVTFTIQSDVIFDDIIIFQEYAAATTFVVTGGATLVMGENVETMSKTGANVKIVVEAGSRLILGGGEFDVENNGGEVIEDYSYDYNKVKQTVKQEETVDYSDVQPGVTYIDFNAGKDTNDGLTSSTQKKTFGNVNTENAAMHIVRGGGTIVSTGRLYIGSDYTIPNLGSELTITGEYGGVNYVNAEPANNPAGGMIKILSGKTLTIAGEVRLENIILFQESTQNAIKVASGGKLTIGENVIFMTRQLYNMKLVVENGGTVVFETAEIGFDTIEGDGIVIVPKDKAVGFEKKRAYDERFTDVSINHWFYSYVKNAYEYELANGTSAAKFSPDNKFTVAQALTAAANIHTTYFGKSVPATKDGEQWYTPYVNYCLENGIISVGQFADYGKNITRGEMAIVFANILPESEYAGEVSGAAVDVTSDMGCYNAVAKLYKAGIVSGDAGKGTYRPNDEIARSEACVIFTRIALKSERVE
ncbi:MAG: S-layer homology domain-containing protein [Clostridia bacterium]|nr:S-layer homology domain-containing protein [Clostridia bacterium]